MLRYNPANATVSGQVAYLKQQIAIVSATPMVIETDPINPMIIARSNTDPFDAIAINNNQKKPFTPYIKLAHQYTPQYP